MHWHPLWNEVFLFMERCVPIMERVPIMKHTKVVSIKTHRIQSKMQIWVRFIVLASFIMGKRNYLRLAYCRAVARRKRRKYSTERY